MVNVSCRLSGSWSACLVMQQIIWIVLSSTRNLFVVGDLAEQRHSIPPNTKHAEMEYPFSVDSALMLSPCKPDKNGYFGGTSGLPSVIQYGFEIESIINGNIPDALDAIREHVMDTVVSFTFPSICEFRDISSIKHNNAVHGVTGFNFGQDYDAIQSCLPKQSTENECSIFTGLLSVYGIDHITTATLDSLMNELRNKFPTFSVPSNDDTINNNSNTTDDILNTLITYGISRMNISEAYTQIVRTPDLSAPTIKAKLSILIPMTFLLLLAIVLIAICVIIRCVRAKRYNDYECKPTNNKLKSISQQDHFASNKGEYAIVRSTFWDNLFYSSSKRNSCDRTQTSSSSSSSMTSRSRSTRQTNTIRTIRAIFRKRRSRQYPIGSIEYSTNTEPECIYIVEPDTDYSDDNDAESIDLHQQIETYDSKLYMGSGRLIDDERRIPTNQNDPLYVASSMDNNIGFEVN